MNHKWKFLLAFLLGALISAMVFRNSQKSAAPKNDFYRSYLDHKIQMEKSLLSNDRMQLLNRLLDEVENELNENPQRKLEASTIYQIQALSETFESRQYNYLKQDSLAGFEYSAERGQLLQALMRMRMDSITLDTLKSWVSFDGAELANAQLAGFDLSGIRLMCANLENANLSKSNISNGDLRGANLWGADLSFVKMAGVQLNRAKLQWANLNDADVSNAAMGGVKLNHAQLRRTLMSNSDMQMSDIRYTIFAGADLSHSNLSRVEASQVVFSNAKLNEVNFRFANLKEATFEGAQMSDIRLGFAEVNELHWMDKISEWKVEGVDQIQEKYHVIIPDDDRSSFQVQEKK